MTPGPSVVSEWVCKPGTRGKKPVCDCGALSGGESEAGKRQEWLWKNRREERQGMRRWRGVGGGEKT